MNDLLKFVKLELICRFDFLGTSNERTSYTERRDELSVQNWQCRGEYKNDSS